MDWSFSAERGELYSAFSELDVGAVARSSEVNFPGKRGGRVQFKYADLDAILPVVKEACKKVGLAPIQFISQGEGRCIITTHVGHKSGQWLECTVSLPADPSDPKTFSAMATYLKRYQISAVFQIATEEDEDAKELPAGIYTGSNEDKRWLVKALKELPQYKFDQDQKAELGQKMKKNRTPMSVDNIIKVIEEDSEK